MRRGPTDYGGRSQPPLFQKIAFLLEIFQVNKSDRSKGPIITEPHAGCRLDIGGTDQAL
jgi:hypothetical protein